ncbi:hypothetical protein THOM_0875 [Trachipleistophora hominis]|uniref:Uncharacterized protein n=1 Tax=Trachipleistophora hominis TaxID=72359 RepID=L7JZJ3_TRAHO|nr:hypothetical protein THOM_0875 [Trachipleistophora hominis]
MIIKIDMKEQFNHLLEQLDDAFREINEKVDYMASHEVFMIIRTEIHVDSAKYGLSGGDLKKFQIDICDVRLKISQQETIR